MTRRKQRPARRPATMHRGRITDRAAERAADREADREAARRARVLETVAGPCPRCHAAPGHWCVTASGRASQRLHVDREPRTGQFDTRRAWVVAVLELACPYCLAPAGTMCVKRDGAAVTHTVVPHARRVAALERAG